MGRLQDLNVLALVLAGGRGSRLGALTRRVAKPAVPFGAQYRIIDFTLSNCINSGIRRIAVLTQYQAHALIVHLQQAWGFLHRGLDEFVEIWPAQQDSNDRWYGGTADAVYQNLVAIRRCRPELVIVLPGDHVSQTDYRPLIADHLASGADVTVACAPVPIRDASRYGIVQAGLDGRIAAFTEKPRFPLAAPADDATVLASMGIYVFDTACLERELRCKGGLSDHDFGRDLIPAMVADGRAHAHIVSSNGSTPFWRDVGTLDAYYSANMALLDPDPLLDLSPPDWPLLAQVPSGPPARFGQVGRNLGVALNSLIAPGCVVMGGLVRHSLLFRDVRVERGALVEDCVALPGAVVGPGARVRHAIIDSGCHVPANASIDAGRCMRATEGPVTLVTESSLERLLLEAPRRAAPNAASRRRELADQRIAG